MSLEIVRSFTTKDSASQKAIEFFWSKTTPDRKSPVLILIHGHHPTLRMGARNDIASGMFEFFADNGFLTISISQPGYGCSDGPADYCGADSQAAVSRIIDFILETKLADPERIVVQGWSRGANVAALAAAKDNRISGLILGAGLYDLVEGYDELNEGIRKSLSRESNGTIEDLKARSPIYKLNEKRIPILMIHGSNDAVASPKQAQRMFEALSAAKKDIQFELLPDREHGIPLHVLSKIYSDFLIRKGFVDAMTVPLKLNHADL